MGYTLDQLEAMGAKPVTQPSAPVSPTPSGAKKKYTLQELQAAGAKPVTAPSPAPVPQKTFSEKAGGVLDAVFGAGKIGELIGTQIAKRSSAGKELARQEAAGIAPKGSMDETFKNPTAKELLGSTAQAALTFAPVGRAAQGIGAVGRLAGLGAKTSRAIGAIGAGAGTGYGYDVASGMAQGEENPLKPGLGTAIGAGIPLVGPAVRGVGRLAGETLGASTGTGFGSVRRGLEATSQGGKSAEAFRSAMRGNTTPEQIVDEARGALGQVIRNRSNSYRESLGKLKLNTKEYTKDALRPVVEAFNKQLDEFGVSFSGKGLPDFSRSPGLGRYEKDLMGISQVLKNWGSRPDDLTVVGIDKLKQVLDDFRIGSADSRKFDSFVTNLRNEAKKIIKNEPEYDKMVKDYESSTGLIKEIQRGLSLGDKAQADTAFRKLTGALRVNNEFRKQLIDELDSLTEGTLSAKVAGQQMSEILPRGLVRPIGGLAGAAGVLGGVGIIPLLKVALLTSPRLVGELLSALGYGASKTKQIMKLIAPQGVKLPGDAVLDSIGGKKQTMDVASRSLATAKATQGQQKISDIGKFERAGSLSLEKKRLEEKAFRHILKNEDKIIRDYFAQSQGGKYVNADDFRPFFKEVGYSDGRLAAAVQEPASYLAKRARSIALQNPGEYVVGTAGGSGVGKTAAAKTIPEIAELQNNAAMILDSNFSSIKSARSFLKEAEEAGKQFIGVFTYRDFMDALENGVVKRMLTNKSEMGRLVPTKVIAANHTGSFDVVKQLAKEGKQFWFVDNSLGNGNAKVVPLEVLEKKIKYPSVDELTKAANAKIKELYETKKPFVDGEGVSHTITKEQYESLIE